MPTYHDFIYDSTKDEPTYTPYASAGVIMEFHSLPDPAMPPGTPPPPMKIIFKKNQFAGKYKTTPATTPPTVTASQIIFVATPGTVRGDPCNEVRIMLDPAVAQAPGGYQYEVRMQSPVNGNWVKWDPRVIPK